jgi:tetratricopeptide (TPR) repeat protein
VNRFLILYLFLLAVILSSCSTITKRPESQANQKARLFLEQGRKEELKQNYPDALSLFKDAEHNSILANEFDLQLISLQGEARIVYLDADTLSFNAIVNRMQELVQNVRNESEYRVLQLKLWKDFHEGNYSKVLEYNINNSSLPLNARIEILSYVIQAKSKLQINHSQEKSKLIASLSRYQIKLKHRSQMQPELISNAYYSLAYSEAAEGNYTKAISWLTKAKVLDRDYDLYIMLADDYALAGKCEMKRNDIAKAKANFTIARQIYFESQKLEEANKMENLIKGVSGK